MKHLFLSAIALLILSVWSQAQNTSPYWSLNGNSNATLSNKIGTTNAVSLRFVTRNVERMKIHNNGNVGIGTPAPFNKLHVRQNVTNRAIQWQHETFEDYWTVGIGTNTRNCRFEFNGLLRGQIESSTGSFTQGSDSRLKEDIQPMVSILDKMVTLQPSTYYYKSSRSFAKNRSIGFIAQDIEKVFPELVFESDDGYKLLDYSGFSVIAVKAIQEQQIIIKEQQEKNDELEARITKLEELVMRMSNSNGSNNALSAALLKNIPNPAKGTTRIVYTLPEGTQNARLIITDNLGKMVKSIQLNASGMVNVDVSPFSNGTYNYSLIVDNKTVQTKKMIVQK